MEKRYRQNKFSWCSTAHRERRKEQMVQHGTKGKKREGRGRGIPEKDWWWTPIKGVKSNYRKAVELFGDSPSFNGIVGVETPFIHDGNLFVCLI